ncbi:NAD(P)H-dependent oxidoreductase [Bombilactobacillus folatiphilus]|uniref:NAD(P)H-dependent oxidoreductase n=1 Tax=Bombilactobacillus folatiphilus TaxID=2923362 RepID=A0ABY4P7X7_9LACO|nr:NAD(P)H-dependent oxidoreductase [Bombilactobacillus folatiphilus]UQS81636.1 NAD(P)H-dependent oxidoreductase [Bombilactobacillus folatiphilus]
MKKEILRIKTLVIVAHPQLNNSSTQQFLKQGALLAQANWHELSLPMTASPEYERQLLRQAQRIIFQFPLYWYSEPAVLKQWEERYLSTQFVESELGKKELGLVVSTGLPRTAFRSGAKAHFGLDQLLVSFQGLARQAQMTWLPIFSIYQFAYMSEQERQLLLMRYQRYLSQDFPDSLLKRSNWYLERLKQYVQQHPQNPQLELVQTQFQQNIWSLENSLSTVQLIKQGEDDSLE